MIIDEQADRYRYGYRFSLRCSGRMRSRGFTWIHGIQWFSKIFRIFVRLKVRQGVDGCLGQFDVEGGA